MHTHTNTHLWLLLPSVTLLSGLSPGLQKRTEWKRNKTMPNTMKTEDSVNQSLNEVGALHCMSGSNYGGKGKRIKVLSHPGVPLVGLMLLATLPFGASIKQSVPRVKLSHKGKYWNNVDLSVTFIVVIYLHLLWFFPIITICAVCEQNTIWINWGHFRYFISCQQPSSSVHFHLAGFTDTDTLSISLCNILSPLYFSCGFEHTTKRKSEKRA